MMGRQGRDQGKLFYEFRLEDRIPENHLLRRGWESFYSDIGRPSVAPELMIRMLVVGYCYGIRSERRLTQEVELHLAYASSASSTSTTRSRITRRSRSTAWAASGK
jgi:transposase